MLWLTLFIWARDCMNFPSFSISDSFSRSSAAFSKKVRSPALTSSAPDFITVLTEGRGHRGWRAQDETERFMDRCANADGNVCSPGVEGVSEDVQAADHHCRVTSWKRNICGRCGQRLESKRQTSIHRERQSKPYQREKSCVWQELPAYRTGWERKTARKELNKKASERTKMRGNKQSKQGNKKKSEGKHERRILHSSLR